MTEPTDQISVSTDPATPHLIVTRFMIGVARATAFMRHAAFMLETLYPSLAAQTSKNFHWVVITDALIDEMSRALIEERFNNHPNFHLHTMDPFRARSNELPIAELCRTHLGTYENVITTRIDDDDGLRLTFVDDVQRRIADARRTEKGLISCSFVKGMRIAVPFSRYDLFSARAGASAGMSLFSPNARKVHVHSFGHNKVHLRVEQKGGTSLHVDTPEPYYLVGVHPGSASREKRDQEKAANRVRRNFKPCSPQDPTYAHLIQSFGLPLDFAERLLDIGTRYPDPRPPMLDPLPETEHVALPRMSAKKAYLVLAERLYRQAKEEGRERGDEIALDLYLLRQAYYSL